MKILELEILEVRGIRRLLLQPNGGSVIVVGPNGTGKSGIVDAIDFLLTGKIQRLEGKGTKSLSLRRHGVHIGALPANAKVRAKVSIPGVEEPIEICRALAKPQTLEVSTDVADAIAPALSNAEHGQHSLSRREILRFIAAEPKDRAQQVQSLMRLSEVEDCRQALMRVKNELKIRSEEAERRVQGSQAGVSSAAQLEVYDPKELLATINAQRILLGGPPLEGLQSAGLQLALSPPTTLAPSSVNAAIARKDIAGLREALAAVNVDRRRNVIHELTLVLESITHDPVALRDCRKLNLYELGRELLNDECTCPLCDTPWPEGALASLLADKIERSHALTASMNEARRLAGMLANDCRQIRATTIEVSRVTTTVSPQSEADSLLTQWLTDLDDLERQLDNPVQEFLSNPSVFVGAELLRQPPSTISVLDGLDITLESSMPATSAQQTAWDLLTRIGEHTKLLAEAERASLSAQHAASRAAALYGAFETAQNEVLQELYDQIRDRFVELYREVHSDDEAGFGATMKPDGAGVAFEVDFYGEGQFPPNALHSEGHQDSMGLCLYLALAERLNRGVLDVIVLDDVVMSVDTGHRRHICRVLSKHLPDVQFIITTHERAWADQLIAAGVAKPSNRIDLYNWSLETGPLVAESPGDMWTEVRSKLARNDISGAAHALRLNLERFFRRTCGSLKGQVPFNVSERWSLGDFLPASVTRLDKYIGEAINVAQSSGDTELKETLIAFRARVKQARSQCTTEQGVMNPAVHYNEWANYSRQDFEPLVNAMQELCDLFSCQSCGGILEAVGRGDLITEVRCVCGKSIFRLTKHRIVTHGSQ